MNEYTDVNCGLDEFLDETPTQQAYCAGVDPPLYYENQNPQYAPVQPYWTPPRKNIAIVILLSAVLVVGIAILAIQIFRPFDSSADTSPAGINNNGGYYQNGNPPNMEGREPFVGNEDDGPVMIGPGGNGGGIMARQTPDGTREYSTDGGKTWNETPPN
jgi:hypothetical protein